MLPHCATGTAALLFCWYKPVYHICHITAVSWIQAPNGFIISFEIESRLMQAGIPAFPANLDVLFKKEFKERKTPR
jgi:hypothetical protein